MIWSTSQNLLFHSWLHCYIVLYQSLTIEQMPFFITPWCKMAFFIIPWCKMTFFIIPWCKMAFFITPWCKMTFFIIPLRKMPFCFIVTPFCFIAMKPRGSCPTPKFWSKYQFLHYFKALKHPESIQQCSQRWNKVTCSMVSDKTLRNHHFGELLDL